MSSVQFTIGDGLDDESRIRGRLAFGGASVVLELHTDAQGHRLPLPRKVVICVREIAGCRYRRGLLADRLHLRVASMAALGGVPGAYYDMVSLRFSKRDRRAAEGLAKRLRKTMVERPPEHPPEHRVPPVQVRPRLQYRPVA